MKKFKQKIGDEEFTFSEKDLEKFDCEFNSNDNFYHILENNKSYKAKYLNDDIQNPKAKKIAVNGTEYEVEISDEIDLLIQEMGLNIVAKNISKNIVAPMPGLILDLMVKEGDEIKEGETVLVLEAMKMENALKAAGDGIVKSIKAAKGDTVDKGTIIIEIE